MLKYVEIHIENTENDEKWQKYQYEIENLW